MAYNNLLSVQNNFNNPGNYNVSSTVTINGFGNLQETRVPQQQSRGHCNSPQQTQGHCNSPQQSQGHCNGPQQSGLMFTTMPDLYSSSSSISGSGRSGISLSSPDSSFGAANGLFSSSCSQQPQSHLKNYNSSQQSGITYVIKPDLNSSSSISCGSAPSGILPTSQFGVASGQFSSSSPDSHANYDHVNTSTPISKEGRFSP